MEIQDIIWLDVFVDKLWRRHRVHPDEVEEVLIGSPKIRFIERGKVKGEDVYAAMAKSQAGRYLMVFFIRKRDNKALVIGARDMTRKERRYYEKKKQKGSAS